MKILFYHVADIWGILSEMSTCSDNRDPFISDLMTEPVALLFVRAGLLTMLPCLTCSTDDIFYAIFPRE